MVQISELLEFIQKGTVRHFFLAALAGFIFIIGIACYEYWTGSFHLARLQRVANLAETADNLTSHEAQRLKMQLLQQAERSIESPLHYVIAPQKHSFFTNFGLGIVLWSIPVVAFGIITIRSKFDSQLLTVVVGLVIVATISALIACVLPEFLWPVSHILFYPLFFILSSLASLWVYDSIQAQRN